MQQSEPVVLPMLYAENQPRPLVSPTPFPSLSTMQQVTHWHLCKSYCNPLLKDVYMRCTLDIPPCKKYCYALHRECYFSDFQCYLLYRQICVSNVQYIDGAEKVLQSSIPHQRHRSWLSCFQGCQFCKQQANPLPQWHSYTRHNDQRQLAGACCRTCSPQNMDILMYVPSIYISKLVYSALITFLCSYWCSNFQAFWHVSSCIKPLSKPLTRLSAKQGTNTWGNVGSQWEAAAVG